MRSITRFISLLFVTVLSSLTSVGCGNKSKDKNPTESQTLISERVFKLDAISGVWFTGSSDTETNDYTKVIYIPKSKDEKGIVQIYQGANLLAEATLKVDLNIEHGKTYLQLAIDQVSIEKKSNGSVEGKLFYSESEKLELVDNTGDTITARFAIRAMNFSSYFGEPRGHRLEQNVIFNNYPGYNNLIKDTCRFPEFQNDKLCAAPTVEGDICSKSQEELTLFLDTPLGEDVEETKLRYAGRWHIVEVQGQRKRCRLVPDEYRQSFQP